jgi:DNA-binding response OmpR family regulator
MLVSTPTTDIANTPNRATCLSVVIVEDHEDLRNVMVDVVTSFGHHVVGLSCAEEMDDEVGGLPIDLLIVDLNLPGEDGISLAKRFRAAQPLAGVIMATGRSQVHDKVTGYNSGADIYLQKPVSTDELMAAINSLSRRLLEQVNARDHSRPTKISLDASKLQLAGPQGEIGLTDTEALILSALARAPGQRLEIWQLLALLKLDLNTYSKSAFEVRMVRLRKKLITVGAEKHCIRSIRMLGYQLSVALQVY